MFKVKPLIVFLIFANVSYSQSNQELLKKFIEENDSTKIMGLLDNWQKSNPYDPELYTSAINYYYRQAKKEIVTLDREQRSMESFEFTDSTGKVAGYINSTIGFDSNFLSKAFTYATTGIERCPDRLDLRFGKCYMLKEVGDFENFSKELVKTVEYAAINKNNWLWTDNKLQQNGQATLLETIQTYLKELYDTENDDLLPYMIQIGEATLTYYPDNVEILSSTPVALLLTKEFDKAISHLKHAETLNPKDFIVLNNIAQAYKLQGDKVNAIKYYELTEKYGDAQAKKAARNNINQLKQK